MEEACDDRCRRDDRHETEETVIAWQLWNAREETQRPDAIIRAGPLLYSTVQISQSTGRKSCFATH
jgi:hypothetical protein